MKEIVMVAALAAFITVPALAQKQESTGSAAAKAQTSQPTEKVATAAKKGSRRQQDARHCLDLKGNIEIIKCAEQYL